MAGMAATPGSSGLGEGRDVRATVTQVLPQSPAEKVGLMPGDKIEALQTGAQKLGNPLNAETVTRFICDHQNESLVISVFRKDAEKGFVAKPEAGLVEGKKALGINMADVGVLQLPPHLALLQGAVSAKQVTISTAQGLGVFFSQLFRGVADWGSVAG